MNSLDIFSKIYLNDIVSEATIDYKKQLSQNNPAAMNSFLKSEIGLGKLIREMCDTPTPKFKKSSPTTMFYCEGISSSSRKPAKNFSKFMKSLKIKNFENLKSNSSFQTAISYLAPNIIFNETIDNSNKNYICGRNHVLDLFNESQLNDLMARTKKLIYSIFIYNKEKISNELKAQSSSSAAYAFKVAGMTITENTEDALKYKIDWNAVPEEMSSAEENSSKSLKLSFRLTDLNEKIKMQWKIFVNNVIDILEEILVDNSDSIPNKNAGYDADQVEEYLENSLEEYLTENSRIKFLQFIEVMLQMYRNESNYTYEIEFESTENEEASSNGANSFELQTESSSMSNIAKEIEEQLHEENLKFFVKNESGRKLYFNPEPRARNYGVKLSDISNHINNSARKAIYESLGIEKEEFKAKCLAYGEEICRSATERNIQNDTSEIAFTGNQPQTATATSSSSSMNYKVTLSEDEIDNLLDQISRGYSKVLDYDNIAMIGDRWIRKFYDEYKSENTLLNKQRLVALLKLVYNINPSLISKYNREKPEGYPSY